MPMLLQPSNPVMGDKTFGKAGAVGVEQAMTLNGTVNKTGLLLIFTILTASWTWNLARSENPSAAGLPLIAGLIGGLIVALATAYRPAWSPVTAPLYALLEGLVLGGISAIFETRYPGIAVQAVMLTVGTLVVMLALYRARIIQATEKFKTGVFAATGGIMLVYFVSVVLGFFGIQVPKIYDAGPIGILFSLFVVSIAALNLIVDFDLIEKGAAQGAPKYMEWYGGFAILVTLVWLYMEILRLLSKLRSRQ
ncbi:MAG TPA: Bax inhibitor-1/YccA family protein [Candidatus Acidoferrales bacterium]|nr:Bax inhibitor-1/YccA family protein [Candidatus Acidoferrales bacterium]